MVNAQALQTRNGLPPLQLLEADDALALVVREHVVIVGEARLGQAHHHMRLHVVRRYWLAAHEALEVAHAEKEGQRLRQRVQIVVPMGVVLV